MRVSRLQVSDLMTVAVAGESPRNVALPGPSANDQQYDTIDRLNGPRPVPVHFTVDLRPGWNDVAFDFRVSNGERLDLGAEVLSAAVAPDLAFTQIATSAHVASAQERTDRSRRSRSHRRRTGSTATPNSSET